MAAKGSDLERDEREDMFRSFSEVSNSPTQEEYPSLELTFSSSKSKAQVAIKSGNSHCGNQSIKYQREKHEVVWEIP
jgi:hypothetical protein